jgi:hypothetical protein
MAPPERAQQRRPGLVAAEFNDRPRKRLAFKKPIEQIKPLLLR